MPRARRASSGRRPGGSSRSGRPPPARRASGDRWSVSVNATEGLESAAFVTAAATARPSASGEERNLRRAGVRAKRLSTSNVRPARSRRELLGGSRAVLDPQADRLRARPVGGRQRQPRDRGDRRQRLAPEPVGPDADEVLVRRDLGGGMALQRQARVLATHARAVVPDEDPVDAAPVDLDVDPGRPGVESVLDELLDGRGRPLDDLAGGDAIDDGARQAADAGHSSHPIAPIRRRRSRQRVWRGLRRRAP